MLTGTVRYLQTAPFLAIFPGLAIVHRRAGVQPHRRRLREALDPKLRGRVVSDDAAALASTTCASSSGPSRGTSTRSTASRSTSARARRSGSSASRAAGRASRRSRCSGSCRAPAGRRPGSARARRARPARPLRARAARRIRGKEIAMIFQDPMTSLNPVLTIGAQIREALEAHFDLDRKGATRRAAELLDQVGIPSAADAPRRLPAPVLGRHAPARDDRDGARLRAEAPDRRRADDGARRHDPGADPRPAPRARRRARTRR